MLNAGALLKSNLVVAATAATMLTLTLTLATLRTRSEDNKRDSNSRALPRPSSTLPWLENTLDFWNQGHRFPEWEEEVTKEVHGKTWLLRGLGRPDLIVLSTPQTVEDVQKTYFDRFGKGDFMRDYMRELMGAGIVLADGELWRMQRKSVVALLSAKALRDAMASIIPKHTAILSTIMERAADSAELFDMSELLHRFTMEVFMEIGFGIELGSLQSGVSHPVELALDEALHATAGRFDKPAFVWKLQRALGLGDEEVLAESVATINKFVMEIISQMLHARAQIRAGKQDPSAKSGHSDIVSLFLDSSTDAKGDDVLDPTVLRDIVVNMVIGGRGTSAETMTWLLYQLDDHPEVERRIREEIRSKMPLFCMDDLSELTMRRLSQLTYLEAAIKESMRLQPPNVQLDKRECFQDTVLSDGTFIPKGTTVGIAGYTMARRTDVWGPDAAEFKPERWIDPQTGKLLQVSAFQFNAFLAGPRMCAGMNLALAQMKTVLVMLLGRFHVMVVPGQRVTCAKSFTTPMKGGLQTRIERVSYGPASA